MASSTHPAAAPIRRLLPLAVAAGAAVLLGGCQTDAAETLPRDVAHGIRSSIGIATDVTCVADEGPLVAEDGVRFTCTATSPQMEGSIRLEGVFLSPGLQRSRPLGGTGRLGAVAGFVDRIERP